MSYNSSYALKFRLAENFHSYKQQVEGNMIFKLLKQYFRAKLYGIVLTHLFKKFKNPKYKKVVSLMEYAFTFFEVFQQKKTSAPKKKRNTRI